MGEIVIKVPEDVREVIDLGLPYREVKEKLNEIFRFESENRLKEALRLIKSVEDNKTWKDTKEELENEMYSFD